MLGADPLAFSAADAVDRLLASVTAYLPPLLHFGRSYISVKGIDVLGILHEASEHLQRRALDAILT